MRARLALALLLALCMTALSPLIGSAFAATQVTAQEEESEGQDQGGQDPETETGAEEGQTEGAEETGPPWTYQMARLGIALMVLLALGIGLAYYRFVTRRQRGVI